MLDLGQKLKDAIANCADPGYMNIYMVSRLLLSIPYKKGGTTKGALARGTTLFPTTRT